MIYRQFCFALCILFMGCAERAAYKNVRISLAEVEGLQGDLRGTWKDGKVQSLSWKRALVLLDEKNLRLKRSRFRVQELLGERKHFVWRQLNPRLIAYANFNAVLGDLAALSSNGFGASLLGSVNVPDPVGYYGRRYALELQYYQALLNQEKLERDLKASLYDLFLTQDELDDLSDKAVLHQGVDYKQWLSEEVRAIHSEARILNRQENLRLSINKLLDSPGANYQLKRASLPHISYASRISRLDSAKGYGRLAVFQMAGQLEMANARLWQVKFAKLPRVSSGVSLPSLYQEDSNQDFQFEDVGLFTSLNRSIEFTGRRKRDEKRAKQQIEYIRHTMKSRMEQEMVRFEQSKRVYRLLLKEARGLAEQQKFLRKHPPEFGVKTMIAHVKALEDVAQRIDQNQKRVHRMDLRFWVWDDKHWGLPF